MDLYKPLYHIIRPQLEKRFTINAIHPENILEQPAIYAANHIDFADSPIIAATYTAETGRPLRFVAKQEYFDGKGTDGNGKYGRTLKFFMKATRMIPVDRESVDPRAFHALQLAVAERVANGNSVALHPEATRSDDGMLYKFKSGAARIALALSVPIVPVGLVYNRSSNSEKTQVDVLFGRAVMPEEYSTLPYSVLPGRQKAEHLSQVVEDRVAAMTGMKQAGIFAELRKHRDSK